MSSYNDILAATRPATGGAVVTPHNSTNLANNSRLLFVGGAGNLTVVFPDDTTVVLTGVTAGTLIPIEVKRVNSTGTTATNITALW